MAYGVKFTGSIAAAQSLDGNVWTVEILERDYAGGATTIQLAAGAPTVMWGQAGSDRFAPILPSSAEVKIFDKANAVLAAVAGADEEEYRVRIKKGANVFWFGKLIADQAEHSRDKRPRTQSYQAIDGLGALEDISYTATGRVRVIEAIADILAATNLGLNISAACNWFTPEIASNEDPLDKIKLDCDAFLNVDGTFKSYSEVLTQILTRFGLQLYQKDGAWKVIQVELLASGTAYTYYTYDAAGTQTGSSTLDPTITVTEDQGYQHRKLEGTGKYLRPYKTTTVEFRPITYDAEPVIKNPGFETNTLLADWTKSDPAVPFGQQASPAPVEGLFSAQLGTIGSGAGLPAEWVSLADVAYIPITNTALVFKSSARIYHPFFTPDARPRHLWIEIQVGDYYWAGGTWELIAGSILADRLIEWSGTIASGHWGVTNAWVEFAVNLSAIDRNWVGSRQLKIFLYQCVDQLSLGDIQLCLWDDLKLEGITAPNPAGFGKRTIATDSVSESTGEREIQELSIGDSYARINEGGLTVGDTIPTANWKRGPYGGGDAPTGVSIDELLTSSWMRMQKATTLEVNTEEYIRKSGGVGIAAEIDNVLEIGSKLYAPTEFTRDLAKGKAAGEFVEVRTDDTNITYLEEGIVEGSSTGGGGGIGGGGGSGWVPHTHTISQVLGLQTALDAKAPVFDTSQLVSGGPQTWYGVKSFIDGLVSQDTLIIDSEIAIGFRSLNPLYNGMLQVDPAISAWRTYTLPDAGGTIALLDGGQTFTNATWHGAAIGVGYGGTGKSTWTQWGIAYADTTTSLAQVAAGTSGQVLRSGGAGAPDWSTATYPATVAAGDLIIATGANAIGSLAIGTAAKFLQSSGTAPQWFDLFGSVNTFTTAQTISRASGGNAGVVFLTLDGQTNAPDLQFLVGSDGSHNGSVAKIISYGIGSGTQSIRQELSNWGGYYNWGFSSQSGGVKVIGTLYNSGNGATGQTDYGRFILMSVSDAQVGYSTGLGAGTVAISLDANPSNITYFNAGNVGIGQATAAEKLTVNGNVAIVGTGVLKIGTTTVLDASRNLSNVGTVGCGAITTSALMNINRSDASNADFLRMNNSFASGTGNQTTISGYTKNDSETLKVAGQIVIGLSTLASGAETARITFWNQQAGTWANAGGMVGPNWTIVGTLAVAAITTSGLLKWSVDNTYDIGANNATRPKDLYLAGEIKQGVWNAGAVTAAGHVLPSVTDTYDLGSSTKLWRKGWLSEMDAILFAQNTVTVIGGWLVIGKDEGALPADVASGATTINFGKAMTVGHFVLFRAALKVEYMQVGSLVSGTTYNVTRNLDGSGANDWPAGSVFLVLGASGDGRIELNSYDTPRISMITQGATYNASSEWLRIGDLNGMPTYAAPHYGIFIGDATNYLKYDKDSAALVLSGSVTATSGTIGGWTLNSTSISNSGIVISTVGVMRAADTIKLDAENVILSVGANIVLDGADFGTLTVGTGAGCLTLDGTGTGTITGGTIRTAASGARIVMAASGNNLVVYNTAGSNVATLYGDSTVGIVDVGQSFAAGAGETKSAINVALTGTPTTVTSIGYGIDVLSQLGSSTNATVTAYAGRFRAEGTQTGETALTNYGIYASAKNGDLNWAGYFGDGNVCINNYLRVGGAADNTTEMFGIYFGSSHDTNLYRADANVLKTDDSLIISGSLIRGGSGDRWLLKETGGNHGMYFWAADDGVSLFSGGNDALHAHNDASITIASTLNNIGFHRVTEIYTMGDSLTFAGEYQTHLLTHLDTDWNIANCGIGGNTTTQMEARFDDEVVTPGDADYVVIMAGINDIIQDVAAATIEAKLQAMYTAAHNAGATVVAVQILPFKGNANWTSGRQAILDAVNTWIASTATNVDDVILSYAALEDGGNPDTLQAAYVGPDWLHLVTAGYNALADLIYAGVTWTKSATNPTLCLTTSSVALNQNLRTFDSVEFQHLLVGRTLTVVGAATINGLLTLNNNLALGVNTLLFDDPVSMIYRHSSLGLIFRGTGSSYDLCFINTSGNVAFYVPTGTQDLVTNGSLKTADPGSGSGDWKLGTRITAGVTLDAAHYVEGKVGSTVVKFLIGT